MRSCGSTANGREICINAGVLRGEQPLAAYAPSPGSSPTSHVYNYIAEGELS